MQRKLGKIQQGTWRLCDIVPGDESWFRHKQLGQKSSHAAWVRRGDPPPTVVRQSRYAPRTLLVIFFKSNGSLLIHCLERGQNINHQYNIDNCLRPVVDEIKRQKPSYGTRGIKSHHDNQKPHVHKNALAYLESEGLTVVPHPTNSPDLIKKNLADQSDSQSLHDAVVSFMSFLSNEEYKKTFEQWIERMQLCIDN